ncbi:GNAT family N-acetyltransferase [Virgibacillus sp. DJP39]|uniref:GNAT family N-acetyltransferase n=1 Tax=Virgibacillus sp. DJP39 TaxID=3409790 RepID=UPI003BB4B948
MAINPTYKRLGIASKLHDTLIDQIKHNNSLLTTGVENRPAINFYNNKGWELIKSDAPVISDESLQVIMGKVIN